MHNHAFAADAKDHSVETRRPFLCMCAEYHEDPPEIVCAENQRFIEALRARGGIY
jgi:hypothetical protein